jgi:GNAT superfamily N-acetyltransferase
MELKRAITVRELKTDDWPHIISLFGDKGACGGCWCMAWRVPHGGKTWQSACGEPNKKAFKKLVSTGEAHGILAFDGDQPVGWCNFGRRTEFPRLETVKAYRRDDIEKVWSINCFFILKQYRSSGVSAMLLAAAVKAITKRKGKIIEGYPVPLTKDGKQLPAAFSYTGPEIIFERAGFKAVQRISQSRPLYRLESK